MNNPVPELELTGERTLPDHPVENYWFMRHVVVYRHLASIASGLKIADVGCGEGYGPAMLAGCASEVVGIDASPEVINHARLKYTGGNLRFETMDAGGLNLPSNRFDLVVSLQVIEHLADLSGYLEEIVRILAPCGKAIISTPNRIKISPGSETPVNPFHLREYTAGELRDALSGYFRAVELTGLFHAGLLRINDFVRVVDFIKYYEMGKLNPRYWTHHYLTPRIREKHFRLSANKLDKCHDIIAICQT